MVVQLFSDRCERPYGGLSAEQTAVYVATGGRLACPADCDDQLYALLSRCWRHRAARRPTAAAVHRRLAALQRSASTGASTPPPPPLPHRPAAGTDTPRPPHGVRASTTLPRLHSDSPLSSETLDDLRPTSLHLSASEELLQPERDVYRRNAAVRIRDSFRKLVSSRKSAPAMASLVSPLTSPTGRLFDK